MKATVSSNVYVYSVKSDYYTYMITTIKADSSVTILDKTDYWYHIKMDDGTIGYCEVSSSFTITDNSVTEGSDVNTFTTVNYTATVLSNIITARISSSDNGDISGSVNKGDTIKITKVDGLWYYIDGKGWFNTDKYAISVNTDKISTDTTTSDSSDDTASFNLSSIYDYSDTSDLVGYQLLKSTRGIFGMPYQYMEICDPRLIITNNKKTTSNSIFGRKYAQKLVQNMPLLLMTPGKPKFMKTFNSIDKKNVLAALVNNDETTLSALLSSKNGKFYSLEFDYSTYYSVVNPMLKNIARLLNIQNKQLNGVALSAFNWQDYRDSFLNGFLSSKESVAFYIDSETQIQETFSNNVGQSSLASSMNQLSDISREVQFLLGSTSGTQFEAFKKENYETSKKSLDSFVNQFSSILPSGLADRLSEGAMTVAIGGKLIFPEIWNDSEFSKSYDVTIKLRTPDPNPFSIFMDLFVPLCHLIALVAPIQLNGNGYTSPFLVRGYYKGMFDIDMGIITNMSITKGDKGSWTLDGLPTTIDVQFTIKDLYNIFSLTPENNVVDMLNNTAEMDYLANLCGININNVDIQRSIKYYYYNILEGLKNKVTFNNFLGVQNYVSNMIKNVFAKS